MNDRELVAALRERARVLYEGRVTPHRSCGIALAETFGRPTAPYQSLRRGGLTGDGPCGAILAGQLLLGEIFGDPDPTGSVTPALREATTHYRAEIARRLSRPGAIPACDALLERFADFQSDERKAFCTDIAATVAEVLADTVLRFGGRLDAP
ncbi:MAG TPA: hypothetical protein VFK85_11875 [Anaeromyxobacteraceae bacterium]|nr:hypothetical protein [Anaeromyxobacteraceae bacterium]